MTPNKKVDIVSTSLKTKMLCPHCGHDNFRAIESKGKFSWLFGSKREFVCAKCNGTFKKANLVRVRQKEKHISARGISKSRHRRH